MSNPEVLRPAGGGSTHDFEASPEVAAAARAAWEEYRAACFLRPGAALNWVWSAAHDFDLASAGLHLDQMPGARLELGTHAVSLLLPHLANPELHEWHLVPLVRLTSGALAAIQPAAAADLTQRVEELLAQQRAAQAELDHRVRQVHLWTLLPGSADGTVQ